MQHGAHQTRPPRREIHELAARASVDIRTAERALVEGVNAIRGLPRERIADAMRELGRAATEPQHAP